MPLPNSGPRYVGDSRRHLAHLGYQIARAVPGASVAVIYYRGRERRCAVSVVNDPMGIDGGLTGSGCLANVITIIWRIDLVPKMFNLEEPVENEVDRRDKKVPFMTIY